MLDNANKNPGPVCGHRAKLIPRNPLQFLSERQFKKECGSQNKIYRVCKDAFNGLVLLHLQMVINSQQRSLSPGTLLGAEWWLRLTKRNISFLYYRVASSFPQEIPVGGKHLHLRIFW